MDALRFGPGCRFLLPQNRCCNCGSMIGRHLAELVAPVPGAGLPLPDRERRFLLLEVPVCAAPACALSLKRQPPPWTLLASLGALCGLFVFALVMRIAPDAMTPAQEWNALLAALCVGAGLGFAGRALRLPERPQSSRYAPVRIRTLSARENDVVCVHFDFTQAEYARDFALAHAAAIAAGRLGSRHVSGR